MFSSDFQFSIPDYQRPYAWGREQALQLVADLSDALHRESVDDYFLGSVVLVKTDKAAGAEVIDGQQRLTTITILLALLRALTSNDGVKSSFDQMIFEPGDALQELEPRPRLVLRSRDRKFFAKYVQSGAIAELLDLPDGALATDAQRNIRDNAAALYEELRGWTDDRRLALSKLLSKKTYLVVVSTADLASAHRIFSVMNSRGLNLSAADIFKSTVVGLLDEDESERYSRKWEDAEDELGRDGFQDLFLHIRMIFSKVRAQRELLQEFPEQVLNRFLPARAKEFIDDVLIPYASALAVVEAANYSWPSGAEDVNRWLRRLARLDNSDWKPVAIWIMRNHEQNPERLAALLARLEQVASAMNLLRVYATPRASRYANLLRELESGMDAESPSFRLSDGEKRRALAALRGPIYEIAPVRKNVLLRLNELVSSAPIDFDTRIITVEHVLPQNPGLHSQWCNDFDDDEREYWVHRLANLVLLDRKKNSEAQNYDFAKKAHGYFQSSKGTTPFPLTVEVIAAQAWEPHTLEARQDRLVQLLADAWSLRFDSYGTDLSALSESELLSVRPERVELASSAARD